MTNPSRLTAICEALQHAERRQLETEEDPDSTLDEVIYWDDKLHEAATALMTEVTEAEARLKAARAALAASGYSMASS